MNDSRSPTNEILVVGAGMAAHRFVERLLREPGTAVRVTVIGDEARAPYDRSALLRLFAGVDPEDLALDRSVFRDDRVRLIRDDRVVRIHPAARTVQTRSRRSYSYDTLVLATGSYAAKVAVEGATLPGCFLFRSIDDVKSVQSFVDARSAELGRPLRGAVIGGGLHGLKVAVALHEMGAATTVIQYPERIMPLQLDQTAASLLQGALEERGIDVRTRTRTTRLDPDESGAVGALEFQDGSFQRADIVVFTVGVRPRDELARNAGLDVHPGGGVLIDEGCATSDPNILAIGEVASFDGRCVTLVGATHAMADVAAARLLGEEARFRGGHDAVQHTFAGFAVASFGDPLADTADAIEVVTHHDPVAGLYSKVVLTDDAQTLLGGLAVGDTGACAALRSVVGVPAAELSEHLLRAVEDDTDFPVCVHIGMSHRGFLSAVRAAELSTFSAIRSRFGRERDCDRCTLAIARVLTVLARSRDRSRAGIAPDRSAYPPTEIQPDGTYTVRPATPEGRLTPASLTAIGRIAAEFELCPVIVGARIELRSARPEHLASVLERMAAAGLAPDPRHPGVEARPTPAAERSRTERRRFPVDAVKPRDQTSTLRASL